MITQEELHHLLEYDPETGLWRWRQCSGHKKRGWFAGSLNSGYLLIRVNRERYYAHTLAWLYIYGDLVKGLDHKDQDPTNNKISNLRVANQSQNAMNTKLRKNNTSGHPGVSLSSHYSHRNRPWVAHIKNKEISKKEYFKTKEEAIEWRQQIELELYREFVPARETPEQRENREYIEYRSERYEIEDWKAKRERPAIFPWER